MKRPWLATGLCLVIVGLGTIGVRHESRAELQRALSSLRANLPPDSRFEYDRAYPRFFARGAGFDNARLIHGSTTLSARVLTINNPHGYLTTGLSVSRIHAEDIVIQGDVTGKISELTIGKLLLPPINDEKQSLKNLPPVSQVRFKYGQIHDVNIDTSPSTSCHIHLGDASFENYGHDDGNTEAWHDLSLFCPAGSPSSKNLSEMTHQKIDEVALRIQKGRTTGLRLAQMVAWSEQQAKHKDKNILLTQPPLTFWEAKSNADIEEISFAMMNTRTRIRTMTSKRWKESDIWHTVGEAKNISLTSQYEALRQILPNGLNVALVRQNGTINTKNEMDAGSLEVSTPDVFTYSMQITGTNLARQNAQLPPTLRHLSLSYEDKGNTINTLMSRIADQQHISLDQLKIKMLIPLAIIAQTAPGLSALPGFLQNPQGHRFSLSFQPPEPLAISGPKFHEFAETVKTDATARQTWFSPPILTTSLQ